MQPERRDRERSEWDPYSSPQGSTPYHHPKSSSSCLKILVVWFLPSLVVPLLLLLLIGAWPIAVLVVLGFLWFMGTLSAGGSIDASEAAPRSPAKPAIGRVILYVVLQLVWIPIFLFAVASAVVWWVCGVNGAGNI